MSLNVCPPYAPSLFRRFLPLPTAKRRPTGGRMNSTNNLLTCTLWETPQWQLVPSQVPSASRSNSSCPTGPVHNYCEIYSCSFMWIIRYIHLCFTTKLLSIVRNTFITNWNMYFYKFNFQATDRILNWKASQPILPTSAPKQQNQHCSSAWKIT